MRSTGPALVAAGVAVVVLLTTGAAPAATRRPTYVALGDSFAAGPGIPAATGGACARSTANYPSLVARRMHLVLRDATCSGATTANVVSTPQGSAPPQLSALDRTTGYVTITIGNNDVSYTGASIACSFAGAAGEPCLGSTVDPAAVTAALGHVESDLVAALRAVRRVAPRARIVLVAYPRTLPPGGAQCPPQNPMTAADSAFLADVGARLQQHLVAAARRAKVGFADTYAPRGHDVCSPETVRWVEGATPESPALIWHPNERGMRAQAGLVVRTLRAPRGGG